MRIGDTTSRTSDRFVTINVPLPGRLDRLGVDVRGCLLSDRLVADDSRMILHLFEVHLESAPSVVTLGITPPICFCTGVLELLELEE